MHVVHVTCMHVETIVDLDSDIRVLLPMSPHFKQCRFTLLLAENADNQPDFAFVLFFWNFTTEFIFLVLDSD